MEANLKRFIFYSSCLFLIVSCQKSSSSSELSKTVIYPICGSQTSQTEQSALGFEDQQSCIIPQKTCDKRRIPDSMIRLNLSHPGGLMSIDQLQALARGSSDPLKLAAVDELLLSTPLDFKATVVEEFRIEFEKTPEMKQQHRLLVEESAEQSYQQALAFIVTCDERYAKNAISILEKWSSENRSFKGRNAALEAAWALASMARAAELLKYTYVDWDMDVEAQFLTWVGQTLEPEINREIQWNFNKWHNNWHTTIAEAKMQLAILRDDRQGFDQMIGYYDRIIEGREGMHPFLNEIKNDRYIFETGQTQETCRDIVHAQFAQGSLLQIPEIAWHQGYDLFSQYESLLIATMEYHAPIIRGQALPIGTINLNLNSKDYGSECVLQWVGFQPTWEIGYHHYRHRRGIFLPETAQTLQRFRPEKYVFHWGLGTLTHYKPE